MAADGVPRQPGGCDFRAGARLAEVDIGSLENDKGRVLGKLNQVPDVIDARRLHGG